MTARNESITKSRTQTKIEVLERAADVGTLYLSVSGREQQISVRRNRDGGFSVVATARDPYTQVVFGERLQFSPRGAFVGGTSFVQKEQSLEERCEPVDERSAEHLVNHLDRLTGKIVMGGASNPYAELAVPKSANTYRY